MLTISSPAVPWVRSLAPCVCGSVLLSGGRPAPARRLRGSASGRTALPEEHPESALTLGTDSVCSGSLTLGLILSHRMTD